MTNYLPATAQNQVDLLCQVIHNQGLFSSAQVMQIASRMRPTFGRPKEDRPRVWRTSDLGRAASLPEKTRYLLAWRNDAPEAVPKGIEVLVLKPAEETPDETDLSERWHRRLSRNAHELWRKWKI